MARYAAKRRRTFRAGLRIANGRPVLVTPGLRRIRRAKKRESPVSVDRMIK